MSLDWSRLEIDGRVIGLTTVDDVFVVGGGNAAGVAAEAMESILGEFLTDGAVVTDDPRETDTITTYEGTHPLPSEANVTGTRHVLDIAQKAGGDDLVLAVVAGGGSSLLCAHSPSISLEALRSVTQALLASGADIGELNAVRKHCSAIKGGQLARVAAPATVHGLIFSDVIGNELAVIASGPTTPNGTTFEKALAVLDRYGLADESVVRDHLESGEYQAPCGVFFTNNVEAMDDLSVVNIGAGGGPHHLALLPFVNRLGMSGSEIHVISVIPQSGGTPEPIAETLAALSGVESVQVHNVSAETVADGLVAAAVGNGGVLFIGATRDRRLRRWVFGSTPDQTIEYARDANVPVVIHASTSGLSGRLEEYVFPVYRYLRQHLGGRRGFRRVAERPEKAK